MPDLPLSETVTGTLDAAGDVSLRIGPTTSGTQWNISNLAVSSTSAATTTAGSDLTTTYVIPSANQSVNNTTTLTSDTTLTTALTAGHTYEIDFWLSFSTTVNCDLVTDWLTTGTITGFRGLVGATGTAASFTSRTDTRARFSTVTSLGQDVTYQLDTSGNSQLCWERGIVTCTADGTLTFRFAQAVATVGNLTRDAESFLRVVQIS